MECDLLSTGWGIRVLSSKVAPLHVEAPLPSVRFLGFEGLATLLEGLVQGIGAFCPTRIRRHRWGVEELADLIGFVPLSIPDMHAPQFGTEGCAPVRHGLAPWGREDE